MYSTPYDSNQDDEAEHLVTTDDGISESNDLPLDNKDKSVKDDDSIKESYTGSNRPSSNRRSGGGDDDSSENEESQNIEYLKKPTAIDPTIDDGKDNSKIEDSTRTEVAKLDENVREGDLTESVKTNATDKNEMKRSQFGLRPDDSASSFNSNLSEVLPGEPSKVKLTYERGISVFRELSIMHLAEDEMVDAEVQVNLHRPKKKPERVFKTREGFTQTLEMTFVSADNALIIYRQIYPQMEDYKPLDIPSRQASLEQALTLANQTDPDIDTQRKGPEILSLSNKKQILQPLMDEYHKDELLCTGARFTGEYLSRQFFKGRYLHPTGTVIESEFVNGHFQTNKHFGVIAYPRGDTFEGEWNEGRYETGTITFADGVKFSSTDWKYCEPPDRRLKVERYYGLKPAGKTLYSDQNPPPTIPPGTYDVGEGYYNPKTNEVRRHDGLLLRKATDAEAAWIRNNCRRVHSAIEDIQPKFLPERIPGTYCDWQQRLPLSVKRYH